MIYFHRSQFYKAEMTQIISYTEIPGFTFFQENQIYKTMFSVFTFSFYGTVKYS